jgi:radical SAM protein with 4Fe4S-binding SPASM domain
MDAFYDGWLRQTGAASIAGYTDKAGQLPDRSLVNMQPPVRTACRRTRSRCVVLADGRVAACDQDLSGLHELGSLTESSLAEIWQSAGYQRLREIHATAHWADHPLCRNCAEWHRP